MNRHLDRLVTQGVGCSPLVGDNWNVGSVAGPTKRSFGWDGIKYDFDAE